MMSVSVKWEIRKNSNTIQRVGWEVVVFHRQSHSLQLAHSLPSTNLLTISLIV